MRPIVRLSFAVRHPPVGLLHGFEFRSADCLADGGAYKFGALPQPRRCYTVKRAGGGIIQLNQERVHRNNYIGRPIAALLDANGPYRVYFVTIGVFMRANRVAYL